MRLLDSHLHMWDPAVLEYAWLDGPLRARFDVPELQDALASAPPAQRAFVFVQAECRADQTLAEVDWVGERAGRAGIVGIVARAALERGAAVAADLEALRSRSLVAGVRRLLQDEPVGFAVSDAFVAGARATAGAGLTFDACIRPHQLDDVAELADAVPQLTIVLDHLAKPAVGGEVGAAWRAGLARVAERPNVVCKLSGLPAEAGPGWDAALVAPYLDAAAEAFGPGRLLFGGDWPVSGPYGEWVSAVTRWATRLSADEADAVLWGNAHRVYGLG